jgi:hypothetical protein
MAVLFLVISVPFMVPAIALTWFRARGNVITMDPFLEMFVWLRSLGASGRSFG